MTFEIKVPSGKYSCWTLEDIIQEVLRHTDPEGLEWSVGVGQRDDTTLEISLMSVN